MQLRAPGIAIPLVLALVGAACGAAEEESASREVTIPAADGVLVYGDLTLAEGGKEAPLLLLFHQARANARGEYGAMIPRLVEAGFSVLAIDQRTGGSYFGGENRTMAALEDDEYSYCDAYPDLEAALRYVVEEGFTGPRFAWGSSYSAALVIRLGVEHGDELAGVLAFSPAAGDPMGDCQPDPYASELEIPALVLRPASEMDTENAQKQLALFAEAGHRTYVAPDGVHGSSMLSAERVDGDVELTWAVVMEFLSAPAGTTGNR
jgi:pimeloyl-ACP methyl ester carboxylesterase